MMDHISLFAHWRALLLLIALLLLAGMGCVWYGYNWADGVGELKLSALRAGYDAAAAGSAKREAERYSAMEKAIIVADGKYHVDKVARESWFNSRIERVRRDAEASVRNRGVQATSGTPGICPEVGHAAEDRLFEARRRVIELVDRAYDYQSALTACYEGWPGRGSDTPGTVPDIRELGPGR